MSGGRYQRVPSRLWTDPVFRGWSDPARSAALYLMTCPHRNTEGLFRLPVPLAAYDLGWSVGDMAAALAELEVAGFVEIDSTTDLVWIRDALSWDPPANANRVKGAVRVLMELPVSPLLESFLAVAVDVCPDLASALVDALGWASDCPDGGNEEPVGSPFEAPSEGIGSPSEADPNSHSHSPSLAPSPSRAPETTTHPPRSTQEGRGPSPGGGGGDPSDDQPEPSPLADQVATAAMARMTTAALAAMGYPDAEQPSPDDLTPVRAAVARGWTPEQIHALAVAVAADPEVRSPRSVWRHRLATRLPPAEPDPDGATPIPPVPGEPLARFHPDDCPGGCDHDGWVTIGGVLARCTGQPIEATA